MLAPSETNWVLLDSITDVRPDHRGLIAVSGSHGGLYPAAIASKAGLRAVVFNDAGIGLAGAGIAGLVALDQVGMAGLAVSCESAEIGSASETLKCGVVSFANRTALGLGVKVGQPTTVQLGALAGASVPKSEMSGISEGRWVETVGEAEVLCVDSASMISPDDAGQIIVTGSHGGLVGGDPARACKADAKLVVFNDAGGGKNAIGFSRLAALDRREIASVTVDARICQIGSAASTLAEGVISRANETAHRLGFANAQLLRDMLPNASSC